MARQALVGVWGVWLLLGGIACGDGKEPPGAPVVAGQGGNPDGSEDQGGQGGAAGEPAAVGGSGDSALAGAGAGAQDAAGGGGMSGTPACATPDDCDDSNPCTDDACGDDGACAHTNNVAACDDANECTDDDTCKDGACVGTPNAVACDDLSSCTSGDKCGEGACNGIRDEVLCPSCVTSANILQNCDFSDGGAHWVDGFTDGRGTQRVENRRLIVDIEESGVELDDVEPRVEGIALKQGMKYRLRLVAGASVARKLVVEVAQVASPHQVYSTFDVELAPQMKPFSSEFVMRSPADGNAKLGLLLGGAADNPSRVYVDDVALEELPCAEDDECDDQNDCTTDICEQRAGTCSWTNTGAACLDDANPCTRDVCVDGKCEHPLLDEHTACTSDGEACTVDACEGGKCEHAYDTGSCACTKDVHCDDHNPCTDDKCNAGACEYAENSIACDDGNVCTDNDVCSGGLCAGISSTQGCDDHDGCTVQDSCSGGFCEAGTYVCLNCSAVLNLLQNCDFSTGDTGWPRGFFGTATGSQRAEQGMLVIEIQNGGESAGQVLARQEGVILTQGQTYTVSFNAKASVARDMAAVVVRNGGDLRAYSAVKSFRLADQLAPYSFDFTMSDPPPAELSRLELRFGGAADNASPNTVWIDNVSVSPKP